MFYNSLAHRRRQLVSLIVNSADAKVVDSDGGSIACQANVIFTDDKFGTNTDQFELWFEVDLPPLGMATYGGLLCVVELAIFLVCGLNMDWAEIPKAPASCEEHIDLLFAGLPVSPAMI